MEKITSEKLLALKIAIEMTEEMIELNKDKEFASYLKEVLKAAKKWHLFMNAILTA